jgi:hypothetical protein
MLDLDGRECWGLRFSRFIALKTAVCTCLLGGWWASGLALTLRYRGKYLHLFAIELRLLGRYLHTTGEIGLRPFLIGVMLIKVHKAPGVIPACHRLPFCYTDICEVRLLGKENERPASGWPLITKINTHFTELLLRANRAPLRPRSVPQYFPL